MTTGFRRYLEAKVNPSEGRPHSTFTWYPITGGRARDGSVLCRHSWLAVSRRDNTVFGCPGYIATHLLRREGDDRLACGFYAEADRVPPLYMNSRWDGRTHWGAYPPTQQELEQRRVYLTTVESSQEDPAPAIIQRLRARGPPTLPLRSPSSPTRQRIIAIIRETPPETSSTTGPVNEHAGASSAPQTRSLR
ncbi:unnamed protein product [Peniophora sp. CBMAI 1063]|nr:unnamed protein product [Peniophora sp. CBMAI 1063]